MRYEPLKGKEKFDAIFKSPDHILKSKNFNALIVINENKFSLGMILPKKNIKLAVHRNFLKRTIRNISNEIFDNTKISMIVVNEHGVYRGLILGVKRISKCHPLGPKGYDPVPDKKD